MGGGERAGTAKTSPVALDLGQKRRKSRRSGECYRRLEHSSLAAPCTSHASPSTPCCPSSLLPHIMHTPAGDGEGRAPGTRTPRERVRNWREKTVNHRKDKDVISGQKRQI